MEPHSPQKWRPLDLDGADADLIGADSRLLRTWPADVHGFRLCPGAPVEIDRRPVPSADIPADETARAGGLTSAQLDATLAVLDARLRLIERDRARLRRGEIRRALEAIDRQLCPPLPTGEPVPEPLSQDAVHRLVARRGRLREELTILRERFNV